MEGERCEVQTKMKRGLRKISEVTDRRVTKIWYWNRSTGLIRDSDDEEENVFVLFMAKKI
jgi:hypothetical protein